MSHDARSSHPDSDSTNADADDQFATFTDPEDLRDRQDVSFDDHTRLRENRDHCGTASAGQAVVGVRNDADELLLLVNREAGIALLPHGSVEPGGDWAATAREDTQGQTGIGVELDGVEAVRRVEHRLEDEDEPHATTHQVVFHGSPTGGEIRDCKLSADAGSDAWIAGWYDGLPDGVEPPEGTPGEDLRLFV